MRKEFQVITINPNLIDLDQGVKYVQHMQESYPEYTIIGLLDGMTMYTLNEEELKGIRDTLTDIIGDGDNFISKQKVDGFIKTLNIMGNQKMNNSDQFYGYDSAITDMKRMVNSYFQS